MRHVRLTIVVLALFLAVGAHHGQAAPPDRIRVRIARLAFPSLVSVMVDIVKAAELDRSNGLDLEPISFSAVSGFYAAQATGEVDAGVGGPHVYQRLRLEGAPVRILASYVGLSAMVVISRNPQVRTITDLRGRSLAADMGSSEFAILSIYAKSKGLDLRTDVNVIQAGPPLARAQLAAGRVDAAMTWEPTATLTIRDSKDYRIIFNGRAGWRELTGKDGWQLVVHMRDDAIRRNPAAVDRLIKTFQDGQAYLRTNLDASDRVVASSLNLPAGVLKEAVLFRRIVYDVRPAWQPAVTEALWEMFRAGVDVGLLPRLPDRAIVYRP
ncbi:MAG: ABC transporter substrate-binding protein [Armatimonadota bacterium]|nr:ABC transporter substrate-binding protein [Armatimonadota bacterium]MDR5698186.1 ABC transporter substrate-binding protein [Armatimonadota bacterium]